MAEARFRISIEPAKLLLEAFEAMEVIGDWLFTLKANKFNTQTTWDDFPWDEMYVEHNAGKKVYEGFPERIQNHMWRHLALSYCS